jgi:hypothetical protein
MPRALHTHPLFWVDTADATWPFYQLQSSCFTLALQRQSICGLREFISTNKKDYIASGEVVHGQQQLAPVLLKRRYFHVPGHGQTYIGQTAAGLGALAATTCRCHCSTLSRTASSCSTLNCVHRVMCWCRTKQLPHLDVLHTCLACWFTGRLGEQSKDEIEEHVSLLVRTITQSLEALKNGVMAAQQPQENGQPLINEHMAAHLHGAVRTCARPCSSAAADGQPSKCSAHC